MRRAVFHFRLFTHTAQSAPVHRAVLLGKCVSTSANCRFNWNLLSVCLFHLTIVLLNLATHTHSIWSSDRIHSFTFIYIHKQVFMRLLEKRVYLILPAINSALFQCMIHGLQSRAVWQSKNEKPLVKIDTNAHNYPKNIIPAIQRETKKKMTSVFFQRFTIFILLLCVIHIVYTFSVRVKKCWINIRMECREKWEGKNRIDRNEMKIYWYDAQNWPTLFLHHFQYCTKYESYKIK